MKSLLSKISSRIKVKRTPIAPCDCHDFIAAVPTAPDTDYLRQIVHARQFGAAGKPHEPLEEDVMMQREHTVRSIAFDLQYRCGGAGRCTCQGAPTCRFPACFSMRPVIKGAEIQAERHAFEVDDAPSAEIRALVTLARQEKLEEVVKGVKRLVDTQLRTAAHGRQMSSLLQTTEEAGEVYAPGSAVYGNGGRESGANPLRENDELREEIVSLYLWRAALLVNLRRDEEAVNSLLNLAAAVEQKQRTRLYGTAAGWACLNDMEIIYYRSLLNQYKPFPIAVEFAHDRALLLPRVFEAMRNDEYHTEYCTHVVFSKEVTATVSRAQAAQMYGDASEDPMLSLCIPLSLPFYRFRVGALFWQNFYNLLCMPPIPPPSPAEGDASAKDPVAELGLTPNHILDAVGRSMMLHHLVMFADTREKEIDSGAVAKRVSRLKACERQPDPSDYEHVLTERELGVAIARMKQLLVVVKSYENGEESLTGDVGSRQKLRGGDGNTSRSAAPPNDAPPS